MADKSRIELHEALLRLVLGKSGADDLSSYSISLVGIEGTATVDLQMCRLGEHEKLIDSSDGYLRQSAQIYA